MVHSRRRPPDEVQRATISLQRADGVRTPTFGWGAAGQRPDGPALVYALGPCRPPLAATDVEAGEETLRGLLQQGWRGAPRRGRPATSTLGQLCPIVAVACEASGRPEAYWRLGNTPMTG